MKPNFEALGPIHPALHFDISKVFASVGVITPQGSPEMVLCGNGGTTIVHWTEKVVANQSEKGMVHPVPLVYAPLIDRWPHQDVCDFLTLKPTQLGLGPSVVPSWGMLLQKTRELMTEHLEFHHPEDASLLACWIVGTYVHPLFHTYPRMNLIGEKGSGKSKVLQIGGLLAFHGLYELSPTGAVLFRTIHPLRATYFLDEMENMNFYGDSLVKQIYRAGYKELGTVSRCEGDHYRPVSFKFYAPMMVGSIGGLNAVEENRSITIGMQPATDPTKGNHEVDPKDPRFPGLRAGLYRSTLTQFQLVDQARKAVEAELPTWLDKRHRELYRAPLTMAFLAKGEGDQSFWDHLLARAHRDRMDQHPLPETGWELFRVVEEKLWQAEKVTFYPKHLADGNMKLMGDVQVGRLLRRYGFDPSKRTKEGIPYTITRTHFLEQAKKFEYPIQDLPQAKVEHLDLTKKIP